MAERASQNGKPTLFVSDRIAIIQQTLKRFMRAGLEVGVLWRDLTRNVDAPVLIASSQTVQSRGLESVGNRFLVAIDEAHIDRVTSARIVDHVVENGGFAVGLTGTPIGPAIAGRWDAMVCGPTTYELAKQGYAIVPELIQRWRPDDNDLEGLVVDNTGEYSAGSAAALMTRFAETIANDIEKWIGEQGLDELPPAILFGATKAHVEHQIKAFKRRGIKCATIFDNTPRDDRNNRIKAFDEGRLQLLGSVSALSVGFDSPRAMLMIGLRPLRRSITEFMQSAGRVARAADGKKRAWVLDYTGTVDLMGEYTMDRWRTGWSRLPSSAPKRRKQRWKCHCGHENHSDRRVCENCNRPKPVGESPFALPECRRCRPPTIQKPGATVVPPLPPANAPRLDRDVPRTPHPADRRDGQAERERRAPAPILLRPPRVRIHLRGRTRGDAAGARRRPADVPRLEGERDGRPRVGTRERRHKRGEGRQGPAGLDPRRGVQNHRDSRKDLRGKIGRPHLQGHHRAPRRQVNLPRQQRRQRAAAAHAQT